ncbi:MAG: RDD family protein [Polyangia bacterium]|jgi:uncharacterized RDD family membrane protein YckC|nr:RDD family protein [Polyangia bacterium]
MVTLTKAQPGALPSVDSYVHVETPENVWLSFRPAGPAPRLWAFLVDFFIRVGILIVLAIIAAFLTPLNAIAGLPGAILLLGYFGMEWFYGCLFEWLWRGRTPGKRVMKLKVIKVGGYPITFVDAFLRNLLRVADGLPLLYGVGLVVALSTRRMQRLGDLVAGTFVVHEEREVVRGYPPWVYGVPVIPSGQRSTAYKPSDRTLDMIEVFLTRAQRLSRERADEIAHILAPPLAARMSFQEERPGEVAQSPGWFLLRVLRTFVYPPSAEEQAAMAQRDLNGMQRPAGTTPPPWMMPSYTLPAPPPGRQAVPGYGPGAGQPSYGPDPSQPGYGPGAGQPSYGPGPAQPSYGPGAAQPSYGPGPAQPSYGPGPAQPSYGLGPGQPSHYGPGSTQPGSGPDSASSPPGQGGSRPGGGQP